MKIRKGFVSNSSSSSFICISNKGEEKRPILRGGVLSIPRNRYSETDFSSGKYDRFDDKLNFLYLQILQRDDNKYYQEFLNFLKSVFERDVPNLKIKENLYLDFIDFIDEDGFTTFSGSIGNGAAFEDKDFDLIFESAQTLHDFLFNSGSYVELTRT